MGVLDRRTENLPPEGGGGQNHFMHDEIISKLGARERRSRTQGKQIRGKRKEGRKMNERKKKAS